MSLMMSKIQAKEMDVNSEPTTNCVLCDCVSTSLECEVIMADKKLILIKDFIDFNYINIVFDITNVDIKLLETKLREDFVNHLWVLEDYKYIAIANCDLQGFSDLSDVYFDTFEKTYQLAMIIYNDGEWFYYVTEPFVNVTDN